MKHHPTKSEQELIVRVGVKSYRRLAAIESAQAAEDELFEKRLAAFHWMKQNGVQAIHYPTALAVGLPTAEGDSRDD